MVLKGTSPTRRLESGARRLGELPVDVVAPRSRAGAHVLREPLEDESEALQPLTRPTDAAETMARVGHPDDTTPRPSRFNATKSCSLSTMCTAGRTPRAR